MNADPSTLNYLAYVLAAYIVAFGLISMMFVNSYRKYRKMKQRLAETEVIEVSETELSNEGNVV